MIVSIFNKRCTWLCLAIALGLLPSLLIAGERRTKKSALTTTDAQSVEMFSAIEAGQIEVKLIPKDSTQSNVLIKNKTDKPLSIKLPETFVGVPVLAQRSGGSSGGRSSSSSGGGSQSTGGGMGMSGGMGGGMGSFNVAPEKVGQLRVTTVCLEHGKGEPQPNIPYEIRPLSTFTSNGSVEELCRTLGTGQLDQRAAQAAAWHFCDNMSWEELAAKRIRHANGTSEPYFSEQEIKSAMQIASVAVRTAEEKKVEKQNAPSDYSRAK